MEQVQRGNHLDIVKNLKHDLIKFIQQWRPNGEDKYKRRVQNAINNSKHSLLIDLKDLMNYNNSFAETICTEYYKYSPHLNQALTQFMHQFERGMIPQQENKLAEEVREKYQLAFDQGFSSGIQDSVRDLKSGLLGKLRSFRGTVTRTTQVRPELIVGIFKCLTCNSYSKPVVQQFKYTQPKNCSKSCDKPIWELDLKKSQFADFQKIRVQQDPTKIPPGAMPRSLDVILRNENTQKGQPGDICHIVGYLCVSPQISSLLKPGQRTQINTRNAQTRGNVSQMQGVTGIKGMRQLNYKLIFIATNLTVQNNQFNEAVDPNQKQDEDEDMLQGNMEIQHQGQRQKYTHEYFLSKVYASLTENQISQVKKLSEDPNLYDNLAQSLFPSIFGHLEIKKALLLQLFGGIHKKTQSKISIRGDINILIVGDPSTAKSQFLKCVNKFVPRSVYTNGKTTSAAGLTASVTRDQNGNIGIQAGALMLADNGICCIDQFDKMDIKDQVAIHEAMQQQTISIAKAGVYATLNARTSILAAANPIFGRYDKSKPLKGNIALSAPIMSRFDLFFVICDDSDSFSDRNLSQFIVSMHRNPNDINSKPKYQAQTIKKYMSVAKKIKPRITIQAAQLLRKFYVEIRMKDKQNKNSSYRVTVRQLQSLIRLSEAYARLHLDTKVQGKYVRQAYRLLSCSIIKLQKSPVQLDELIQQTQNFTLGQARHRNIMQQQLEKKKQQKKNKPVSISHELYIQIQKNAINLFRQHEKRHKEQSIDEQHQISQEDLCNYLLSLNFENGLLQSEQEHDNMKKIIHAVIKKMTKEERILMVQQDSVDYSKKILSLHPNYNIDE